MSSRLVSDVFENAPVTSPQKSILVCLAHHADGSGAGVTRPKLVARDTRFETKKIKREIAALETAGWISVTLHRDTSKFSYQINIEKLQQGGAQ